MVENVLPKECAVCFEKALLQKCLTCHGSDGIHALCPTCIEQMAVFDKSGNATVTCPTCTKSTVIPAGNLEYLKTKLFINLRCDRCSALKLIDDQWWCKDCEETVCSRCAMKHHNSHNCVTWENYDVPRHCLKMCKNKIEEHDAYKDIISKWFSEMEEDFLLRSRVQRNCLLSALRQKTASLERFATAIEHGYGKFSNKSENENPTEILSRVEKKVNVTVEVLKSQLPIDFDATEIVGCIEARLSETELYGKFAKAKNEMLSELISESKSASRPLQWIMPSSEIEDENVQSESEIGELKNYIASRSVNDSVRGANPFRKTQEQPKVFRTSKPSQMESIGVALFDRASGLHMRMQVEDYD